MRWAKAFAAPYGLTGRSGVSSSWGERSGRPKISALDAWTKRDRLAGALLDLERGLEQPGRGHGR